MMLLAVMALLALLALAYSFIEPYWLKKEESAQMVAGLPEELSGLKVVFISDVHYGRWFNQKRLKALVEEVNAQQADLILLGGDYAENEQDFLECMQELSRLRSEYGVFAVLGNHDTYLSEEAIYKIMRENTITPCASESYEIKAKRGGESIYIAGFPFRHEKEAPVNLTKVTAPKDAVTLLLTHSPGDVAAVGEGYSIAFTGHTHGGQISFFGVWGIMARPFAAYRTHWYEENSVNTLHSNGVGMAVLPMRFFARPEWHVVTLLPSPQ